MHTHQEKNIPHIVIMACIYIMPFIPKYFSNCSIANLIRSPICRVYLHYSALLASITFWTWSFKMCHRVFMLRFFVSGDHFSSFMHSEVVNAHLCSIFTVICKIHNKNWRPHNMARDIKKTFGFTLNWNYLPNHPWFHWHPSQPGP